MADSRLCKLSLQLIFVTLSWSTTIALSFLELADEDCFGHAHVFHPCDVASPAQLLHLNNKILVMTMSVDSDQCQYDSGQSEQVLTKVPVGHCGPGQAGRMLQDGWGGVVVGGMLVGAEAPGAKQSVAVGEEGRVEVRRGPEGRGWRLVTKKVRCSRCTRRRHRTGAL